MKLKRPGSKALRKGRRSLAGHYYLLTTATSHRKQVFNCPETAFIVIGSLKWIEKQGLIKLDTAVVMPDHLHFIAELIQHRLSEVMKMLKGYTARKINIVSGATGQIWQPGYHDHAIRKDENLNDIRQYCLHNPVRAGIVKHYPDYPYWFCSKLETYRKG